MKCLPASFELLFLRNAWSGVCEAVILCVLLITLVIVIIRAIKGAWSSPDARLGLVVNGLGVVALLLGLIETAGKLVALPMVSDMSALDVARRVSTAFLSTCVALGIYLFAYLQVLLLRIMMFKARGVHE